jgi:hypothetical protein
MFLNLSLRRPSRLVATPPAAGHCVLNRTVLLSITFLSMPWHKRTSLQLMPTCGPVMEQCPSHIEQRDLTDLGDRAAVQSLSPLPEELEINAIYCTN